MPLQKLALKPGLNREGTDYSNSGGWFDGDKIRFRSGLPEKIGGWQQYQGTSTQFTGTARSIWVWSSSANIGLNTLNIGIGTNTAYQLYSNGSYYDITPYIQVDTLTGPFAATNGSATITVTDANYSPNIGDTVVFSGATGLGGNITAAVLNTTHIVASVNISASTYTFTASATANSSDTGTGGTVTASYVYPIGLNVYTTGAGWGAGPWNAGASTDAWAHGWGTAYSGTGVGQQLRLWTNDNYGYDLVYATRGGPIFYWPGSYSASQRGQYLSSLANSTTLLADASTFSSGVTSITVTSANAPYIYPFMYITGTGIPANTQVASTYITGSTTVPITHTTTANSSGNYNFSYSGSYVPTTTYQVLASDVQEFIIAFGSQQYTPGTTSANTAFNPLTVRWSDQGNAYQWVPAVTNQSGEYTLGNGSYIMGARSTRQEILVWTDSAIYSMQYIGAPYVWGFQLLMDNISVMSPNAMITVNNVTYWMGTDRFFMYNGTVATLPCSLKQYVFDDINTQQAYQVFCGANEGFNEVWWFYVSQSSNGTTIDKYVVYNYLDQVWYYGTMNRSAWLQSGILGKPVAADYNSRLLQHEVGTDDMSLGTTVPITAYVQSSDIEISQGDAGEHFGFVWRMLPDVNFNGSTVNQPSVNIELLPRQNSGSAYPASQTGSAWPPTNQVQNPLVQSANNYSSSGAPEYTVQQFTGQVYTRVRGRQMAFKIGSNTIGVAWQLGVPRFDIRADGRRGG
jgi:hypothetical protein